MIFLFYNTQYNTIRILSIFIFFRFLSTLVISFYNLQMHARLFQSFVGLNCSCRTKSCDSVHISSKSRASFNAFAFFSLSHFSWETFLARLGTFLSSSLSLAAPHNVMITCLVSFFRHQIMFSAASLLYQDCIST